MDEKDRAKDLMFSAYKLHEYCSDKDATACKTCLFNRGYGGVNGCLLKDIPERWGEIAEDVEKYQ